MADDEGEQMQVPVATGLTVADVEALPEDMAIRHLIDGELFEVTPPTLRHQRVVRRLVLACSVYVEGHGGEVFMAPTGVRLSDRDMLEPDLLLVTAAHLDRLGDRYVEGPPDLAVEVSSPSTRHLDLVRKRRQYERYGIAEYWFVDLDAERIEQYVLEDDRYGAPTMVEPGSVVTAAAVPGLTVDVAAVLAP